MFQTCQNIGPLFLSCLALITMGQGCPADNPAPVDPNGNPAANEVALYIDNETAYLARPELYYNDEIFPTLSIHPDGQLDFSETGCASGTKIRLKGDVGTADPLVFLETSAVEITAGNQFNCGDTVHLVYTGTPVNGYVIKVSVNGVELP